MRPYATAACVCSFAFALTADANGDQSKLSPSAVVAEAFEGIEVERKVHYLKADQNARAQLLSGDKNIRNVVYAYELTRDGAKIATAYFDKHRVRTLPETLMIVVKPSGKVERVQVISFTEPKEYRPPSRWYATIRDSNLMPGGKLSPKIDGVTGATLTHRATTRAVKRSLALHKVLQDGDSK